MQLMCPTCKSCAFPVLVRYAADLLICKGCGSEHPGATVVPYTEELTPAGPQLVIPGCEARDRPRTAQLSLWP